MQQFVRRSRTVLLSQGSCFGLLLACSGVGDGAGSGGAPASHLTTSQTATSSGNTTGWDTTGAGVTSGIGTTSGGALPPTNVTASSSATGGSGPTGAVGSSGAPDTTSGVGGSSQVATVTSTGSAGEVSSTTSSSSTSTSSTSASSTTGSPDGPLTGLDGTGPDCTGGSQVDFSMIGWATESGGTSGGKGGTTISVSTGLELQQALKDKQDSSTPLTILVDGVITPANSGDLSKIDVKDLSDVSIIGTGAGAEFNGIGIKIFKASNVILRNLKVHHVELGEKDAISIEGPAHHIWVDHCELYAEYEGVDKDYYDGLLDAKADAEYITYSWNYLHDSWKTSLVGFSESDTFDRKLTMHHNHFRNNNSRLPLFRAGNGHVFNNYYEDIASTAVNSRLDACVRVENNFFSNVRNPWVSAYSDVLGGMELICNVVTNGSVFDYSSSDTSEPLNCTAQVPYAYDAVLNHVSEVPDVVMANAGVGKLDDPTDY